MKRPLPYFFEDELPLKENRCPNALYFVKPIGGQPSVYFTNLQRDVFPISNNGVVSGGINNIISPEGTIDVVIEGQLAKIDVSGNIIDDLEAVRNAIIQPPNYIQPSSTVNFGNPTTVEAGTNLSRIVSTTFVQNDAGQVNNIKIFRDNNVLIDQDTNQNILAVGDNFTIGREAVTHSSQISYDEGEVKENNLGTEDPTGKIQAGTITANKNIVGRLKIFYGSADQFYTTGVEIRDNLSFTYENSSSFSFDANDNFLHIILPSDINISNINITTSNNENLTNNFLPNQQSIVVTDADFNNYNYTSLTYSTALPLGVTISVNL